MTGKPAIPHRPGHAYASRRRKGCAVRVPESQPVLGKAAVRNKPAFRFTNETERLAFHIRNTMLAAVMAHSLILLRSLITIELGPFG